MNNLKERLMALSIAVFCFYLAIEVIQTTDGKWIASVIGGVFCIMAGDWLHQPTKSRSLSIKH